MDRFWSKVNKTPGCWEWTAGTNDSGYGQISIIVQGKKRVIKAHRWAWEQENGPIPAGLELLHSCDNPLCVKPAHLTPGTRAQNQADKCAKGRQARGAMLPHTRLLPPDVLAVKGEYARGRTPLELAAQYGVHRATIYRAIQR